MTVSPLVRRLAALAILFALLWGASAWIVWPVIQTIAGDGARIARSRSILADFDRLEAGLPAFEQRLAEARNAAPVPAAFLEAQTPALAAATLQDEFRPIAAAASVVIRSSQTVPPAMEDGFRRIGLTLELGTTPEALQHLLYRIETATPALFIRKLAVRLPEDGTVVRAADGQPQLTVHIELCAYQNEAGS
jgi:Type II secretion system (T2SS), protein M subtype b